MAHPLHDKIDALRTRVRRLVLRHGLSAVLATVLGAVILLGLLDYGIHFQDRGIRIIASLVVLGLLGWALYWHLYRPLATRLRDVDLAARVQERFPDFSDRLVSAVEFLRQSEDDPTAGSAALRRAVIAQTTSQSEQIDFSQSLDLRPPRRAVAVAAGVGLIAATLFALDPAASQIALARLLDPLGPAAWPQVTHLEVRPRVTRVARGQPFEVEAVDSGGAPLPDEVRIHYRFEGPDGTKTIEAQHMQFLDGAMLARRENITRPFEYRIEGGDDHGMDWIPVEVIEPPAIQSLAVTLVPPAYTGWRETTSDRGGNIRALVGTQVRIEGAVTRPLASATLRFEGGRKLAATVSEDGLRFSVSRLVIDKSGAYWFRLTDREEVSSDSDTRWEIRAVPDSLPTVVIEQPTSNLFVTPRGVVPLRIVAKDNLALQGAALVFSRQDDPGKKQSSEPLPLGPNQAPPQPDLLAAGAAAGDHRVIQHRWQLEPLGLAPGTQLTFYATATDRRPQTGKSEPRLLTVITPEELQDRIAARQNLILTELARVLKLQHDSRSVVQSLEIRARETGGLEQVEVDRLQAAEQGQRQVRRSLTSATEGVTMHVVALLADLENNRVDSPDIQRRMQALLDEIARLERELLPTISRDLTAAMKSAQIRLQEARARAKRTQQSPTAASLADAGRRQDEVIASLEAALGQMKQWDDYRRFHREVAQLLHDQEELARGAAEVGRRTLTKELKDLTPQDLADLKVHAARQLELARRLERIEQDMEQTGRDLRAKDPLAADTVTDAVAESRRLAIGAAMRTAGDQLHQNRMGQVVAGHRQIAQNLQEVLDILANRRHNELVRLVKKLLEAEADLKAIQQEQGKLQKGLNKNSKDPDAASRKAELDRLRRRQQELQEETQRMARRLERLLADRAGRTTAEAAEQMNKAGRAAGEGDSASAAKQAHEADETLKRAVDELSRRRLQAQTELALEQLARLEDSLKHVAKQQESVLKDTREYAAMEAAGPLTRAQAAGLRDVARLQQSLQTDTAGLAEQMAGAGSFHLALTGARDEMGRAAALLNDRQTGPATQQAEQNALARMNLMLKALEPEKPQEKSGNGGDGGTGSGSSKKGQPGGVAALAELKLLQLMQEDVNQRTERLDKEKAAAKEPTEQQKRQYLVLAEEQGRLADLAAQMLRAAQQNPEDETVLPPEGPNQDPQNPPSEEDLP